MIKHSFVKENAQLKGVSLSEKDKGGPNYHLLIALKNPCSGLRLLHDNAFKLPSEF